MPQTFEAGYKQSLFLMSTARFVGLFGGIGSGKTAAGSIKAIQKINDGEPGIIVGPDFPHFAKSTWPEFAKWLPWSRVVNAELNHPYTQQKILKIQTRKGIIPVYYGGIDNPSAWAGPSVNWFWGDEMRRKPTRQAFDVLAGRIRIGDNPQGWITTTPRGTLKGQLHWLRSIFERQEFPEELKREFTAMGQELVEYWTVTTQENEKNLDPLYYKSLSSIYTGRYGQQELSGEFVTFEGQVYENFYTTDGTWGDSNVTEEADYIPGVPIMWGVDDGFVEGHPRTILFGQIIPPFINIFAEYVVVYENAEDSIKHALDMYPKPQIARADSAAAELRSRLWHEGIETSAGSHNVEQGVKHAHSLMRDGNGNVFIRFHPRCVFSINELQAYCYPDTVETNLSPSDPRAAKPQKEADNVSDALRYMVWPIQIDELRKKAGQAPKRTSKVEEVEQVVAQVATTGEAMVAGAMPPQLRFLNLMSSKKLNPKHGLPIKLHTNW